MLENLGMIGVSWRQGGSESLAEFTPSDERVAALGEFAARLGLAEVAYIATCNRVELIFARAPGTAADDIRREGYELLTGHVPEPGQAERRLRAWHGEGAAEHLFLIAAGLDSACVGETEIVGQVRAAHERARQAGLSGPTLELVFEEAQRIAARVRGETGLGRGRVSLAEIAVDALGERVARTPGTIALIGVSPMTERAARSLHANGLPFIVVNRSKDAAARLAGAFGVRHLSLDAFREDPPAVEAVLSATGASEPILSEPALERLAARTASGEAPLIVDMAVPPDIDVAACSKLDIQRLGMDEIVARAERNRARRLEEAADAREQVDAALDQLQERLAERYYGPMLGALQRRYRRTADEGLNRLLKKELKGLGEEEREAIETWTRVLARRFAHIPCMGLRGLLNDGPEGSVQAFLGGLEPEFADELRGALGSSAGAAGTRNPDMGADASRTSPSEALRGAEASPASRAKARADAPQGPPARREGRA